ncbi:MAG: tetratricopeptide repeat protein, partial [Candidatus Eremiobacterota bacterium]
MDEIREYLQQALQLEEEGKSAEALEFFQEVLMLDPDQPVALLFRGFGRIEQSEYERALIDFERAIELEPELLTRPDIGQRVERVFKVFQVEAQTDAHNPKAHFQLARAFSAFQMYDQAMHALEAALQLNPDDFDASYLAARLSMKRGDTARAIKEFQQLLRGRANRSDLQYELGMAFVSMGSLDTAYGHLEKACALSPMEVRYRLALTELTHRQGDYEGSLDGYRNVLRLRVDHPDALIGLGRCLAVTGRLEEALEHLRKAAALRPDDLSVARDLARLELDAGDPTQAVLSIEAVVKQSPEDRAAWRLLADAAEREGLKERCREAWERLTELNPDDPEPLVRLAGMESDPEPVLRRGVERFHGDPRFSVPLAQCLKSAGRGGEARDVLLAAARTNTTSFEVQRIAGLTLLEEGDLTGAGRCLRVAVRLKGDDLELQFALGQVCLQRDQLDEAFGCFKAALRVQPGHFQSVLAMAELFRRKGQYDMAQDFLDQAMEVDPASPALLSEMGNLAAAQGNGKGVAALIPRLFRNAEAEDAYALVQGWVADLRKAEHLEGGCLVLRAFLARFADFAPASEDLAALEGEQAAQAAEEAARLAEAQAAEEAARLAEAQAAEEAARLAETQAAEEAARLAEAQAAEETARLTEAEEAAPSPQEAESLEVPVTRAAAGVEGDGADVRLGALEAASAGALAGPVWPGAEAPVSEAASPFPVWPGAPEPVDSPFPVWPGASTPDASPFPTWPGASPPGEPAATTGVASAFPEEPGGATPVRPPLAAPLVEPAEPSEMTAVPPAPPAGGESVAAAPDVGASALPMAPLPVATEPVAVAPAAVPAPEAVPSTPTPGEPGTSAATPAEPVAPPPVAVEPAAPAPVEPGAVEPAAAPPPAASAPSAAPPDAAASAEAVALEPVAPAPVEPGVVEPAAVPPPAASAPPDAAASAEAVALEPVAP